MTGKMQVIISSLLLILALHFLLQGINYKKIINISNPENFEIKQELSINEPDIVASNKFIDDKI